MKLGPCFPGCYLPTFGEGSHCVGMLLADPLDSLNPMSGILSLCKTPGLCRTLL